MVLPRGWWWSGAGGWLRLTLVSLLAALPVEQLRAFPSSLSDCQTPTGWNCSDDPNSQELLQSTEERLANTMKMTDTSVHKDYQHRLVCVTERKSFQIPVVAIGPRAILHFPDEFILPICPVKAATEKTPYVRTIGNSSEVVYISLFGACKELILQLETDLVQMDKTYMSLSSVKTSPRNTSDFPLHCFWTTQHSHSQGKVADAMLDAVVEVLSKNPNSCLKTVRMRSLSPRHWRRPRRPQTLCQKL